MSCRISIAVKVPLINVFNSLRRDPNPLFLQIRAVQIYGGWQEANQQECPNWPKLDLDFLLLQIVV